MLKDIEDKIAEIQRNNKILLNKQEEESLSKEKELDSIFLDAIEILDVFNREEKIIADHKWNMSDESQKTIKQFGNVKKRILSFLSKYSITKVEFANGLSNDDTCTIVDTEPDTTKQDCTVISVEKDGYMRNGHVLRRAEVVTVKN